MNIENFLTKSMEGLKPNLMSANDLFKFIEEKSINDRAIGQSLLNWGTFAPHFETQELATHYLAWVDLPGVKLTDIAIKTRKDMVLISGSREHFRSDHAADGKEVRESQRIKFTKQLTFRDEINPSKIEANFTDGVLTLAIPKKSPSVENIVQVKSGPGIEFRKIYETSLAAEKKAIET